MHILKYRISKGWRKGQIWNNFLKVFTLGGIGFGLFRKRDNLLKGREKHICQRSLMWHIHWWVCALPEAQTGNFFLKSPNLRGEDFLFFWHVWSVLVCYLYFLLQPYVARLICSNPKHWNLFFVKVPLLPVHYRATQRYIQDKNQAGPFLCKAAVPLHAMAADSMWFIYQLRKCCKLFYTIGPKMADLLPQCAINLWRVKAATFFKWASLS